MFVDIEMYEGVYDDEWFVLVKKIYFMVIYGLFCRIKWGLLFFMFGIYYFLLFVCYDCGFNVFGQVVLVDMEGCCGYFFFIEIWLQEVYYFIGLFIIVVVIFFLMNVVVGWIWCGYLCL